MVEDRIQDLNTVNCGIFQIYFYNNLLTLTKTARYRTKPKLNKEAIDILLNQQFVLDDQQQNERVIEQNADERDIVTT